MVEIFWAVSAQCSSLFSPTTVSTTNSGLKVRPRGRQNTPISRWTSQNFRCFKIRELLMGKIASGSDKGGGTDILTRRGGGGSNRGTVYSTHHTSRARTLLITQRRLPSGIARSARICLLARRRQDLPAPDACGNPKGLVEEKIGDLHQQLHAGDLLSKPPQGGSAPLGPRCSLEPEPPQPRCCRPASHVEEVHWVVPSIPPNLLWCRSGRVFHVSCTAE